MMTHTSANSATDCKGARIHRGDKILYRGYGEHMDIKPKPVTVIDIHKQGADGTVLTCDGPPKPEYPNHFSCRASITRLVRKGVK